MRQLWALAETDRTGALRQRCGIVCPQCGMRLRILQVGVTVYSIVTLLCVVAIASFLTRLIPLHDKDAQVFLTLLVTFPVVMVLLRFAPCFARVAEIKDQEELEFPLSPKLEEPESAEARDERELTEALASAKSEPRDISSAAWRCASCGEENPGEFDICWKCQKERVSAGI